MDELFFEGLGRVVTFLGGTAIAIWLVAIFPMLVLDRLSELKRYVEHVKADQAAVARAVNRRNLRFIAENRKLRRQLRKGRKRSKKGGK